MRLPHLALLLAVAACASPDGSADSPVEPVSLPAAAPELSVVTDSLVTRDPAINYRIAIGYPQIEGSDDPAIARINRAIRDTLVAFTMNVRPDPADFTGDPENDRLYVGEAEGGPARTFLGDGLFSSRVDVYLYTGGAHGITVAFPFTYDLATGEPVRSGDLFRPGAAVTDTLAARATARLRARLGAGGLFDDAVPAEPDLFSAVTLGADSLTVFFGPYAVAPYAAGPQEVTWAYAALRDVLDLSGPVGALAGR